MVYKDKQTALGHNTHTMNNTPTPTQVAAAIAMLKADLQKFEALKAEQYEKAPSDWNKYASRVEALNAHLEAAKAHA